MNKFPLHVLLSAAGRMKGSSSTHALDVLINSFPRGFGGFFPAPCTGMDFTSRGWNCATDITPGRITPWGTRGFTDFRISTAQREEQKRRKGAGNGSWEVGNAPCWECFCLEVSWSPLEGGDKHLTLTYTPPRLQIFPIFPFPVEGLGFTWCVPHPGTATWD